MVQGCLVSGVGRVRDHAGAGIGVLLATAGGEIGNVLVEEVWRRDEAVCARQLRRRGYGGSRLRILVLAGREGTGLMGLLVIDDPSLVRAPNVRFAAMGPPAGPPGRQGNTGRPP